MDEDEHDVAPTDDSLLVCMYPSVKLARQSTNCRRPCRLSNRREPPGRLVDCVPVWALLVPENVIEWGGGTVRL